MSKFAIKKYIRRRRVKRIRPTRKGCKYRQPMAGYGTACLYILYTGEKRGCPASSCDKYKPKKPRR